MQQLSVVKGNLTICKNLFKFNCIKILIFESPRDSRLTVYIPCNSMVYLSGNLNVSRLNYDNFKRFIKNPHN